MRPGHTPTSTLSVNAYWFRLDASSIRIPIIQSPIGGSAKWEELLYDIGFSFIGEPKAHHSHLLLLPSSGGISYGSNTVSSLFQCLSSLYPLLSFPPRVLLPCSLTTLTFILSSSNTPCNTPCNYNLEPSWSITRLQSLDLTSVPPLPLAVEDPGPQAFRQPNATNHVKGNLVLLMAISAYSSRIWFLSLVWQASTPGNSES